MSDVEFEQDQELTTLAIPKREEAPPKSIIASELVKKQIVPSGRHANYVLIAISIVFLCIALVFFALVVETPPIPPHTTAVSKGK